MYLAAALFTLSYLLSALPPVGADAEPKGQRLNERTSTGNILSGTNFNVLGVDGSTFEKLLLSDMEDFMRMPPPFNIGRRSVLQISNIQAEQMRFARLMHAPSSACATRQKILGPN